MTFSVNFCSIDRGIVVQWEGYWVPVTSFQIIFALALLSLRSESLADAASHTSSQVSK